MSRNFKDLYFLLDLNSLLRYYLIMKAEHFLSLAKQASRKSGHDQYRMGCVIAKGNKLIASGHNINKTHPKSPHKFKTIHAEFMAAHNAGYEIEGATVYVFREIKDGTPAMAKPCEDCWRFLYECGVKEVVYSFEGSFKHERIR